MATKKRVTPGINFDVAVNSLVTDSFNRARISTTLTYITNSISENLGYLEIDPEAANGRLNASLQLAIASNYANISHSRKYSDVNSLVHGCLESPNYKNSSFQASVTAVKKAAVSYFNSLAISQPPKNSTSTKKQQATAGKQTPVVAPKVQPVPQNNTAVIIPAPSESRDVLAKPQDTLVNASEFSAMADRLTSDIRAKALSDPSSGFDNGKGIKLSAEELKKYTDSESGTFDAGEALGEKYPLLTWYIMSAHLQEESSNATVPNQSSTDKSSSSSMMQVPKEIYNSIMSNLSFK